MTVLDEDFYEDEVFKGLALDNQELRGITFVDCTFNKCSFKEATFRVCKLQNCAFVKCDLSLARVDDSTFANTRFQDSKLMGVNWALASWGKRGAHRLHKPIGFHRCVLDYCSFAGLALTEMILQNCTAKEADFSEANLSKANCTFTDFENSQFRHTDLTEADFTGATNYSIQPHLNTLKKTKFSLPEALSLLYRLDIEIREPGEDSAADPAEWARTK